MQRGGCRHGLSKNSKYYISNYRLYELIYFCLQYPEWKKEINRYEFKGGCKEFDDPTSEDAIRHYICRRKMDLVNECVKKAGGEFSEYLFKAVTNDLSYNNLKTYYELPLSRDKYYEMWHKFFYLLSQEKHTF